MISLAEQCKWILTGTDEAGNPISLPCNMPGDNAAPLIDAGILPDPYFGTNEKKCAWIAYHDWTLTGKFNVNEDPSEKQYFLNLESVDTCAEIFLNGMSLGTTENMFIPFRRWVGAHLKKGENVIEVKLKSIVAEAEKSKNKNMWELPVNTNQQLPYMMYLRKVQCHSGWDWGICVPVSGLYGDLSITEVSSARIERVYTEQIWHGKEVELVVSVDLEAETEGKTCPLQIEFNGEVREAAVDLKAGRNHNEFRFYVPDPQLWYPSEYGPQTLLPLTVSTDSEYITKKIGLRKVELVTELDGPDGTSRSFTFRVNGVNVFVKGSNWIPEDAIPSRRTTEHVRDLLESTKAVHINMLRVWGGGLYEREEFYNMCDELGIMIWQDSMFACSLVPTYDEFLDSISNEIEYQTRRLSTHPCIALWAGDNENMMSFGTYFKKPKYAILYDRINQHIVRNLKKYVHDLPIRRSSPDKGEEYVGDTENRLDIGDLHYWDVWHGGKPFSAYYGMKPRFCSEFGFQSFPSLRTLNTCISPDQQNISSPQMENHQKNGIGNARIMSTFAQNFRMPFSFEDTLYLSQVQQAFAIRIAVEYWRSLKPWCMGAIYWQLNDNWPVASWSSLDYFGEWKALHYEARRFNDPLLLTANVLDGKLVLAVSSDVQKDLTGTWKAIYHSFDNRTVKTVFEKKTTVRFDAAITETMDLSAPAEEGFYELTWEGDGYSRRREFFPAPFKACELPKANLDIQVQKNGKEFQVTLKADAFAFYTFAEQRNALCKWSDNLLNLYPGETVTLTARPDKDITLDEFKSGLKVTHLRATY